jgi:hypothetical protein
MKITTRSEIINPSKIPSKKLKARNATKVNMIPMTAPAAGNRNCFLAADSRSILERENLILESNASNPNNSLTPAVRGRRRFLPI